MEKNEMTYAAAMAEIEAILARLAADNADIDALAGDVKKATELIRECRSRLHKAEEDVNRILSESGEDS